MLRCRIEMLRLIVFSALLAVLVFSQDIKLENGEYKNILIAISDSIDQDDKIIENIRKIFDEASANLFEATNRRARFKEVTILVPQHWNMTNVTAATTQTFDKANIRVDTPSSQHGDNPRVMQTGGCGVPGDYMHLTPNFIVNEAVSRRKWGPLGKVIVHEWGHLRWGLFDEYPTSEEISEHFYQSSTGVEASRCNTKVTGRMRHRITGADCNTDPLTSLPESNCRFYPNPTQSTGIASLMYYHFLPTVIKFCDENEFRYTSVHNYEAPSIHNRLCAGQSAWSVMRDSPDFAAGANQPIDAEVETKVDYNIVQRKDSRVVVVMDVSGSMKDNDYYIKLNAAIRRFILHTVSTGSKVGLVKYSTAPKIITPDLINLQNDNYRTYLANIVPLEHGGGTSIGGGLRAALKLLGDDTQGAVVKVVTDGKENEAPYVAEVEDEIKTAGVIVDTILMTDKADTVLISLAADTSGLSFYYSGSDDTNSLNDAFTQSERARYSDPLKTPITLNSKLLIIPKKDSVCMETVVDKALGLKTKFLLSWSKNITLQAEAKHIASGFGQVQEGRQGVDIIFNDTTSSGKWQLCVTNNNNQKVTVAVQVESTAREEAQSDEEYVPITVRSRLSETEPNFKTMNKPMSIYAVVSRGYAPVIGAEVVAIIQGSTEDITLKLRDNGAGSDLVADDGIYSAYLLNTNATGKHTISVEVVGGADTKVKVVTTGSKAGQISEPGDPVQTQEVKLNPTDEFTRSAVAGLISVADVADPGRDILPPARISDLAVTEASWEKSQITLEWTAVGDDSTEGQAHRYEIYTSSEHIILYKNLTQSKLIQQSELIMGELDSPQPSFEREKFVIKLTNIPDEIMVFGVKAFDAKNNTGALSNLVSAKPVEVKEKINTGLIVGVSVSASAVVFVIAISLVVGLRKKKSRKCAEITSHHKNRSFA